MIIIEHEYSFVGAISVECIRLDPKWKYYSFKVEITYKKRKVMNVEDAVLAVCMPRCGHVMYLHTHICHKAKGLNLLAVIYTKMGIIIVGRKNI